MRMGLGYDVHRLVEGRKLILGGVDISYNKGLLGHSDGDVLLHAIKDALLGAAALGDIGSHFPDTDQEYKDADSLKLLEEVGKFMSEKGYIVNNIDSTIMAEEPKMAPYIQLMKERISEALDISIHQINIKATTMEGLGFVGRKEGIAAQAIASIDRK